MILVVGGAGYIGSHMVKTLTNQGRDIIILDNLSTGYQSLISAGEFIHGDSGDAALLSKIFYKYPIKTVMHFAANSIVSDSVSDPFKYYDNNVKNTLILLKAMVDHKIKHFIFSSTAAVYGEPQKVPITEDVVTSPLNPYGASKLTVEYILRDFDQAYGLKYMSLRYFNASGADESGMIGEMHQPETHLIPLILKTATGEREHIIIFGLDYPTPDGTCIRDYIHVTDLADAHLLAMDALENGHESRIYNLGNSTGYSVKEVINTAKKVTGKEIPVIEGIRRSGDPAVLVASAKKIMQELGWKPQYQALETIIKTAWIWESNKFHG